MLAAIEIVTTETQSCPGCGQSHRLRVALLPDPETTHEVMLGFFRRCPVSQEMVWLVVTLPRRNDGRSWLLQVGPTDDDAWEPDELGELVRSERRVPVGAGVNPPAECRLPNTSSYPPRGVKPGGLRGRGRAPDLLRQAFGCPFHN